MTSCIGVLMLHITFSKYDCIIVHKAYYLFTCTCVSINSFHSHSHSHIEPMRIPTISYKAACLYNNNIRAVVDIPLLQCNGTGLNIKLFHKTHACVTCLPMSNLKVRWL